MHKHVLEQAQDWGLWFEVEHRRQGLDSRVLEQKIVSGYELERKTRCRIDLSTLVKALHWHCQIKWVPCPDSQGANKSFDFRGHVPGFKGLKKIRCSAP